MLTPAFWRRYFSVYDKLNELEPYQALMNEIIRQAELHKGESVLDAGAGTGNLAVKLDKLGVNVTGLDYSVEGLALFKEKLPTQDVLEADLTKPLLFKDSTFDKICTNNTIYTLPPASRAQVFKEFYRVLKPGGILVTSNILNPFRPFRIYKEHIRYDLENIGFLKTIGKVLRFVKPTILIFYYNTLIKREHEGGSYQFFEHGEQKNLLKEAGFVDISDDTIVYAGQAVLNRARRPTL
jgi:ubiquinone/menaquinone biosynthesis C-methylase UbiE